MNERYVNFLPENKGKVPAPTDTGIWQHIDELIKNLSKGIHAGDPSPDALTAIPTVWARSILFAQALIDRDDDNDHIHLQENILGEWRGLVGLFCFKEAYGWRISSKLHVIDGNSDKRFEKTLYDLKPNNKWLKIYLIYLDNILIGGTSPMSLFFTPAEYKCPNSIPWINDKGRLDDPTEYFRKKNMYTELYVLKKWIEKSRHGIKNSPEFDERTINNILRVLKEWMGEISGIIGNFQFTLSIDFKTPIVNEPYNITSYPTNYKQRQWSDFFLKCKIKDKPPIVIVEKLWHDAIVYPPFHTSNILFTDIPKKGEGKVTEICSAIDYNGIFIRPEYLFTNRILKLSLSKDNVVCNNKDYALPLKEKILEFFEPDEIEKLITLEEENNGVKVTLRLPLETKAKSPKFAEVSHFYSNENVDNSTPFILDIWPNFRADDWKYYFCLYHHYYEEINKFSCRPYPTHENFIYKKHKDTSVWQMEMFPKAIICNNLEGNPIGLLPIKRPPKLDIANSEFTVAVDFGTSNTCIRLSRINEDFFQFKNRCFQLTETDQYERRGVLGYSFFPPEDIIGIFTSQILSLGATPYTEPITDSIVLFVDYLQLLNIFKDYDFIENLKWSEKPEERRYISTFLKQIILMIAAEARNKGVGIINIRYSYPSAFNKARVREFKNFWSTIKKEIKDTGVELKLSKPETESVCVCKYLVKEGHFIGGSTRPQVAIDIGGGTTDIAIWWNDSLQSQTSLLLAGDFIAKYAKNVPMFRIKLSDYTIQVSDEIFCKYPRAIINKLLASEYGDNITNKITTVDTHIAEIKRARTIIFTIASGIFYYIGLLIRHLTSQNLKIDGCDFFLAGNGSKLLKWVLGDDYKPLLEIFKGSIGPDISLEDKNINIKLSQHYKEEVARGLLWDGYAPAVSDKEPVMIIGEKGYKDENKELSWDFDILSDIKKLSSIEVPDSFPELERFIDTYNSKAKSLYIEKLVINQSLIKAGIEQFIAEYKQLGQEELMVQSLFILEIKIIIEDLLKPPPS